MNGFENKGPQENSEKSPEKYSKNPELDRHLLKTEITSNAHQEKKAEQEKFLDEFKFAKPILEAYLKTPKHSWREIERFEKTLKKIKKNPPNPEKLGLPAHTPPEKYVRTAYAMGLSDPKKIGVIAVCGLLKFDSAGPDKTYIQAALDVSLPKLTTQLEKL